MKKQEKIYDVVIVGGGVSGTSLLYTLARYTDISNIVLLEKYKKVGQVNSKSSNNSQTLHLGDIETHYSFEKVAMVKRSASMILHYADSLPLDIKKNIVFTVPKMLLGVGHKEVDLLENRYEEINKFFPDLKKIYKEDIEKVEPEIVRGRTKEESLIAFFTENGYAIDFEELAQSFIDESKKHNKDRSVKTSYDSKVTSIKRRQDNNYVLEIKGKKSIIAKAVFVDADSYSLLFAKSLGYGKNFSLIPIAGSFYFSKKILNGKVYTVQEPRLPFASVHGDPDVKVGDATRWGPTARFFPVLESRNLKTSYDYFISSGLNKWKTWKSFFKILLEPVRFKYLLLNMLYELPVIGKMLLVKNIQKIVPSMKSEDLKLAKGYGGMRLQRVDTNTDELQLGEGKIVGENIVFNMTPSPGASVCLYNAMIDAEKAVNFLGNEFVFEKDKMISDLKY